MNKIRQLFCTHWYGEKADEFGAGATPWIKMTCQRCGHVMFIDRDTIRRNIK